jgi:hypothetical protein
MNPTCLTVQRSITRRAIALSACALTSACAAQHVAVPPEFAERFQVLEARERSWASGDFVDESFELGPYRVNDVDRDWDSTTSTDSGAIAASDVDGGYSYQLSAASEKLEARCATSSGKKGLDLGKGWSLSSSSARIACHCGGARLDVQADNGDYTGALDWHGQHYRVQAITELEGGGQRDDPTGYRLDSAEPLALVEVTHPGRLWLLPETIAEAPTPLVCVLTGLLLYQAPDEM